MSATSLAAERAAHAETKRERDEAHDRELSAVIGETEATKRAEAYRTQRDEALKALEETDRILRDIERHETTRVVDARDRISAARRVREGGKVE